MFDCDDEHEISPNEQMQAVARFATRSVDKIFSKIISDERFTVPYEDLICCAAIASFRKLVYDFLMLNVSINIRNHPYVVRCINIGDETEDALSEQISNVCEKVIEDITYSLPSMYIPFIEECVDKVTEKFDQLERENDT